MSLAQTKFHLEKIIALYKNMAMNEKNITAIERDLMLQYVRNLYETLLTFDVSTTLSPPSVLPKVAVRSEGQAVRSEGEAVRSEAQAVRSEAREDRSEVREVPKVEVKPEPKPEVKMEVREVPKVEVKPEPKSEVKMEVREVPKVEVKPEPKPTPPPTPKVEITKPIPSTPIVQVSAEIKALFEEKVSMELSERLSQTPIADLTRAFSINDRLLNIKELFANQGELYHNTLGTINEMQSFAQAENVLLRVATQNNWAANEDRQKQARNFVKVVRRRFK